MVTLHIRSQLIPWNVYHSSTMNHPDFCPFPHKSPTPGKDRLLFFLQISPAPVSTSIHINRRRCGEGSNVRRLMVVILFDPRADILNSIRLTSVPLVPAALPRATETTPLIFEIFMSFPHIPHTTHARKTGRVSKVRIRKRGLTRNCFCHRTRTVQDSWGVRVGRHMTPSRSYLSRNRPGAL